MKTHCKTSVIAVFLLILAIGLQAQTPQAKLDQRELLNQLLGAWKSDIGKDTALFLTNTLYDAGAKGYNKYIINDKIIMEEELAWNFNLSLDKFIITIVTNGFGKEIFALWFTSEKKYERVRYSDIANPEKASIRIEGEILSSDMFIETKIEDNNFVKTFTFIKDSRDNYPNGSRQNPKRYFPPEI
jgi:hypothetical protein